ncbi:hypothetical protein H6P81_021400 [Aristolochia fimbriata]|uniref:Uncharacterized protein n=1 Tax=Aristolochia fimbriata TaxID=158543 RepID=A0AAV7DTQ7_ARIFI|nr:hypothetical protein H6P81_021400 [Aristolochia fimbriata]
MPKQPLLRPSPLMSKQPLPIKGGLLNKHTQHAIMQKCPNTVQGTHPIPLLKGTHPIILLKNDLFNLVDYLTPDKDNKLFLLPSLIPRSPDRGLAFLLKKESPRVNPIFKMRDYKLSELPVLSTPKSPVTSNLRPRAWIISPRSCETSCATSLWRY